MSSVKVLHVSDVHLGSEFSSIPDKQEERQVEILRTFRKITQLCSQESVDLMLIAGDLFEGANIRPEIVRSVKNYLGELACKVFISPGNHDYVAIDSPYADDDWPQNVKIFSGKMERVILPELGTAVYGAGFESTFVRQSLVDMDVLNDEELINICVLHGEIVTENQMSDYNSISLSALRKSQFDYVALGHIHLRSPIRKEGNTSFAYAGCPEGRGFDELGEKGVYIGTISKGYADLAFKRTNQRMYLVEEIDVTEAQTEIDAERLLLNKLKNKYGDNFKDHFYRIRLKGLVSDTNAFSWKNIESALKEELYFVSLIDETTPDVDYNVLASETSLKGYFVKSLIEEMEKASSQNDEKSYEKLKKALEFGLRAFEGQVQLRDY